MTDDSLIAAKAADGFKTESPIRAFTDFQVAGSYAIGKGFRPSLGHLTRYLDAMLTKEGWGVLQIILPRDSDGEPTILFEKGLPVFPEDFDEMFKPRAERVTALSSPIRDAKDSAVIAAFYDDPVNPKHYDGTQCAEIGERLSANGYQVLKYCWRLGKKDDPCVELGKALWYLKREFHLLEAFYPGDAKRGKVLPNMRGLGAGEATSFLEERIADQSVFTQEIARALWSGYTLAGIFPIRQAIESQKNRMECGSGLAI